MDLGGLPPHPPGIYPRSLPSTSHLALVARATLLEHPLLRILYVAYSATALSVVRVPYWFIRYLLFHKRTDEDHRNVFNLVWARIIQWFLEVGIIARITPAILHAPPRWFKSSSAFAKIPILPDEYLKHSAATPNAHGVVLPPSSGQPGDGQFIPAFWYSPPGHRIRSVQSTKRHRPTVGPNAKHQPAIILYLHGGAYVGLTTHEADPATALIKTLTQETDLDVLAVEYRLAGIEAYPAQLQDAAAAWLHLVSPPSEGGLGIAPHRIVVLGDSAGGNLSIALVRWLGEMARSGDDALPGGKGRLGKPRAVMLLSPWCDISAALSMSWPLPDIVPAVYGDYGRSCLLRTHHPSLVYDPKVSPYYDTPEGLGDVFQDIRVYVACGGVECLRPEIEAFVKSLRQGKRAAAADEDDHSHRRRTGVGSSYLGPHRDGTAAETDGVVFDVVEDKPHDFPTIPFYGRASRTLWKRVGLWLREVLQGTE